MFLAVWLIYALDRLLDTRLLLARCSHHPDSAHAFHRAHRTAITTATVLVAAAIVVLLPNLPAALLGSYLLLAALLFAWLVLIHFTAIPLPKAYAPGIFFAVACFIPALSRNSLATLLLPALGFAALCTLNCLLIQHWDRHPTTVPSPRLRLFAFLLMAAPALSPDAISIATSIAASALLALTRSRTRLHPTTLRAAADLALLTPLLLLHSLK